jgi:hypothetical protein
MELAKEVDKWEDDQYRLNGLWLNYDRQAKCKGIIRKKDLERKINMARGATMDEF